MGKYCMILLYMESKNNNKSSEYNKKEAAQT